MEREIEIGGERIRLTHRNEGERQFVEIDGVTREVRFVPLPDGRCFCIVDGRTLEWERNGNGERRIIAGASTHYLRVSDPRKRHGSGAAAGGSGRAEIRAPMPGKVVKILVTAGQEVAADQGIGVLEAMKMENELRTPVAGVVTRLDAVVGATVEPGAVMALVEPPQPADGA
jgi:biotin carboxyl carrier protein